MQINRYESARVLARIAGNGAIMEAVIAARPESRFAWYSMHPLTDSPLLFQPRATWFSEALLPSPFRPRYRGDSRAEARTHADGIIDHFSIGGNGKADAMLMDEATQLVVTEAKIYSPLSGGTRNAPTYEKAARNVACITELLSRANRSSARIVLGSTFDPLDYVMYAIGALSAAIVDAQVFRRIFNFWTVKEAER